MRILQITSGGRKANGAVLYAADLSKRLCERGHDVWMLTPPGSFVAGAIAGSKVRHEPSDLSRWPLAELKRVRDLIRREGIDVVHGHNSRAFNFAVCLRRLFGIPCVSTAHSNKIQVHWCLADRIIAVSQATRRFHCRWNLVRPSRISVIHNPIDTQRFRPLDAAERQQVRRDIGLPDDALVLLIAGHVIARKGQLTAVQAMPRILKKFPQARLVMVGHESAEYGPAVRAEAARLGLNEQVQWLPSRDDVEQVFGAADLCLCPSLDEPFGLTACEALACEVPVVASRLGGFLETIQPDRSGLLVPRKDPDELAKATLSLLQQPSQRQAMGRFGRQWVVEHLGSDSHDTSVEGVYRQVCRPS
ncbi:glycosyltransferase family 4 protein [Roseimaritima ulvae]|uniref:Capsular glucan synthase n=1 Tax=Roseimaritima ulvae TaxID=980254 RepID=A0A5B9R020_9BACT|nr:glycosyltransferase family 4 protein [Roseimaritima ulvae]QEG43560.1 Capsular glucan synthase [Roseimaritima ulvae]